MFAEMGELLGEGRSRKGLKGKTGSLHLAKVTDGKGQMGARTSVDDVTYNERVPIKTLSSNIKNWVGLVSMSERLTLPRFPPDVR